MIYNDRSEFQKIADMPALFYYYLRNLLQSRFWAQGIGRHTQEEVTDIMTNNLKAVSVMLGNKKYFGGEEICEDDCGIFGILAQCLWGIPEKSPYLELMNGE